MRPGDDNNHRSISEISSSADLQSTPSNDGLIKGVGSTEHELVPEPTYRVYKRRWFGLAVLVLLNTIVSWDWLTFAPVSPYAAVFFDVSISSINWMSTAFLFSFIISSPIALLVLSRSGPKTSIVVSGVLLLIGNWVRYIGTRIEHGGFGVAMLGQIFIGFAQPFVLAAPTRYSNLWFSDKGRVSATAVASLANAFGGALGQLIGPFWATDPTQIPSLVLWTAIMSSVAAIPAPFVPRAPPTPPSALASKDTLQIIPALKAAFRNRNFVLLLPAFTVYVGAFNATSSLLNQMLDPYGFSETDAGIAGALLIAVGLVAAAIVSPIIDRTKAYVGVLRTVVPFIAILYLVLIFMPETQSVPAVFVVCSLLGATSFSLLPCALEYVALETHPAAPEVSSNISWSLGQLSGAIFIVIMDALQGAWPAVNGVPAGNMRAALIFQACICWAVVPLSIFVTVAKRPDLEV